MKELTWPEVVLAGLGFLTFLVMFIFSGLTITYTPKKRGRKSKK